METKPKAPLLKSIERSIELAAKNCFDLIDGLLRIDASEKKRTGISVLVRELGTCNLILFSQYEPSDAARFFSVEKAVRAELKSELTSQQSEDPERLRFAGCLTLDNIQVSVSGLTADEDTAVSAYLLSQILEISPVAVCRRIEAQGGILPSAFSCADHYLHRFINY